MPDEDKRPRYNKFPFQHEYRTSSEDNPVKKILNFHFLLLLSAVVLLPAQSQEAEYRHIQDLKELYLTTLILDKGKPGIVIVAPHDSRYREAADIIRGRIEELSGVSIPSYDDDCVPEEILKEHNVIALGNMATNAFIEHMYRQWYVLLDLKYPGKGGYVVRTLHNPYGTGHNVIFVGGSDDAGVKEAARVFSDLLKPEDPLRVGWIMKIKLGAGMNPPEISTGNPKWVVYSWEDSWRKTKSGEAIGYPPSTFFGWNPISIAGILYYMTGEKRYLDCFKTMAMPNPGNVPVINRASDAFNDPLDPLVKNDHYRSHLVDCVYDLIEESPLFTDAERLYMTNKLLEHQYAYDPNNTYSQPNGNRHGVWHMMNIYTGSRYFSKYYPDPVWNQRISNVRKGFNSFLNNPTWAGDDTLGWLSTFIEPVFDFFLMDGDERFLKSSTAKTMMQGLEILMTGAEVDDYNRCVPASLLYKAAYMLKDSRYIWMAEQLGFDLDIFRIGQSFWPRDAIAAAPPTDLANRVIIYPLAKTDWEKTKREIPLEDGFQLLSYRSGLRQADDYFLIDGFFGTGTNPYHIGAIKLLRMFHGRTILIGYANDLDILCDGMADPDVGRSVALRKYMGLEDMAYLEMDVPNMVFSDWKRHFVYLKDYGAIVIDTITSKKHGTFDMTCSWELSGKIAARFEPSRSVLTANGTRLASAGILIQPSDGNIVQEKFTGYLKEGEALAFANILVNDRDRKSIEKMADKAYLITGTERAFVSAGDYVSDDLNIKAEFAFLDKERILLIGAEELVLKGRVIFQSDRPVACLWRLKEQKLDVQARQSCNLTLATDSPVNFSGLTEGEHTYARVEPVPQLINTIANVLKELKPKVDGEKRVGSETKRAMTNQPSVWSLSLGGGVTHLGFSNAYRGGNLWVVTKEESYSRISKVSSDGKILKSIKIDTEILSLWTSKDQKEHRAFEVLVGCKDDTVRAFSDQGEEIWRFQTAIHPSFKIGDRYDAPWFTDPGPPRNMKGVYSILVDDLWNKNIEEIVIGRPCTVEFHELNGKLIKSVPTKWGNNTSLAMLKNPGAFKQRVLLVGKFYTGFPGLSVINGGDENISDNFCTGALPPGYLLMDAWLQRGLSHMLVDDLDGDGVDEVIMNLSGHWNELRVYNPAKSIRMPLWVQYFGPDKPKGDFMRALEVLDLDGDGLKEIIVGMKNGWVCAFDYHGHPVWQKHFESAIEAMDILSKKDRIVAGFENGNISILDGHGTAVHVDKLASSVHTLICIDETLFVGSEEGNLRKYEIHGL